MSSVDFFYPGFEHAGLETPLDRAMTWGLCAVMLTAVSVHGAVMRMVDRLSPRLQPQYDA